MTASEAFQTTITCGCAVLGFLQVRSAHRNRELKRKLRRALKDCIGFHRIEQAFCEQRADASPVMTPLSVKRAMRRELRSLGFDTPSDHANPLDLEQELEKLC